MKYLISLLLIIFVIYFFVDLGTKKFKENAKSVPIANPHEFLKIITIGDIACDRSSINFKGENPMTCQMEKVSSLVASQSPDALLTLGDHQYPAATLDNFNSSYDKSFGRFRDITYPTLGNHDIEPQGGYFKYFGKRSHEENNGYYSFDSRGWHFISLNTNCSEVGGCQKGSPQEIWLKNNLSKNGSKCTIAYFHHPRFSSGLHGDSEYLSDFWWDLYDAGVEIILNGHDHIYESFEPQNPEGIKDDDQGIRQFTVGTGGYSLYPFVTLKENSRTRNNNTFGVLMLKLFENSYDWEFLPIEGESYTDFGNGLCH